MYCRPHFKLATMVDILTIADVKRHLNIEQEYTGDDAIIASYLTSAVAYVEQIICRDVDTLNPQELAVFKQAVLLVVGDFYMQREDTVVAVSTSSTNAVKRLTMSIRGW